MKYLILSILIMFSSQCFAEDFIAEYVKNYDGDTVTVNIKDLPDIFGKNLPIRIRGIDTPEIRGKCIKESKMAVEARIVVNKLLRNNTSILLKNCKRGKYFRVVADIIVNGQSIATELLRQKLAVPYDGGTKVTDWCN